MSSEETFGEAELPGTDHRQERIRRLANHREALGPSGRHRERELHPSRLITNIGQALPYLRRLHVIELDRGDRHPPRRDRHGASPGKPIFAATVISRLSFENAAAVS